jgi:hypothetical protein
MWDDLTEQRLRFEGQRLERDHPNCKFLLGTSSAVARIWYYVGESWYRIRVEVPGTYPDERPRVFVEYPVPLRDLSGRKLSDYAPNHNWHLLTTNGAGEVQICHYSPGDWDASKSIHLVVLKAKLWLTAYAEHHLRTGRPVCDFFGDCI